MSAKDLTAQIEQISGSASFKKDYDVCEAAKAAADEQMSFVFSKKKAVVAEKRQKKEQKEEAEKHIRMQEELVSRHANFYKLCSQNHHRVVPVTFPVTVCHKLNKLKIEVSMDRCSVLLTMSCPC